MAQVRPNKPSRPALLQRTLKFSSYLFTSHHSFAHHHPKAVNNDSTPFFKVMMICTTMIIIQLATLMKMKAINCVIPVTAMSPPPFSKVIVPMEIQSSSSMG